MQFNKCHSYHHILHTHFTDKESNQFEFNVVLFCQLSVTVMPSVFWHCWLRIRKSIQPVKNWVTRCWHGYLSEARCKWSVYGPADATATSSSLASLKSRIVVPFWCQLTQDVLEKVAKRAFVCYGSAKQTVLATYQLCNAFTHRIISQLVIFLYSVDHSFQTSAELVEDVYCRTTASSHGPCMLLKTNIHIYTQFIFVVTAGYMETCHYGHPME